MNRFRVCITRANFGHHRCQPIIMATVVFPYKGSIICMSNYKCPLVWATDLLQFILVWQRPCRDLDLGSGGGKETQAIQ